MARTTKLGWFLVATLVAFALSFFVFSRIQARKIQSEVVRNSSAAQVQEAGLGFGLSKTAELTLGPASEGALAIPLKNSCFTDGKVTVQVQAVSIVCDGKCAVYEGTVPVAQKRGRNLGGIVLNFDEIKKSLGAELSNTLVSVNVVRGGGTHQIFRMNGKYLFFETNQAHMSFILDPQSGRCES